MTPEQEAKIRERDGQDWLVLASAYGRQLETTFDPGPALQGMADRHVLLAELDAARAERDRLRTALEKITTVPPTNWDGWGEVDRLRDIARAALKGT